MDITPHVTWYFLSKTKIILQNIIVIIIFYSTTKHEIIQIKKITIYYVVWTRLTRVGCFNWLAHYKRMRIANKNNVRCPF